MTPEASANEGDASKACRELDRLQKLIADGVPSLMRSFEKIAELAAAQSALLEESLAARTVSVRGAQGPLPDGEEAVRAEKLRLARTYDAYIQHHVQAAVISLQFEDMAVQLISHVRDRVGRMGSEDWRGGKTNDDWKQRTFGPISAEGLNPGSVDLF
jgi:hypothetical protein